jgi:hypothetical protein
MEYINTPFYLTPIASDNSKIKGSHITITSRVVCEYANRYETAYTSSKKPVGARDVVTVPSERHVLGVSSYALLERKRVDGSTAPGDLRVAVLWSCGAEIDVTHTSLAANW